MISSRLEMQELLLLLVEDNEGDSVLFHQYWKRISGKTDTIVRATSLSAALRLQQEYLFSIVILDLGLPDSKGIDTLKKFSAVAKNVPIIVLTGHQDKILETQIFQEGAQDYIVKDYINVHSLEKSIQYSIMRFFANREIELVSKRSENLLNRSTEAVLFFNHDFEISYANKAALDLFNVESKHLAEFDLSKSIHRDLLQKINSSMAMDSNAGRDNDGRAGESYIFSTDGSRVAVSYHITQWEELGEQYFALSLYPQADELRIKQFQDQTLRVHRLLSKILGIGLLSLTLEEKLRQITKEISNEFASLFSKGGDVSLVIFDDKVIRMQFSVNCIKVEFSDLPRPIDCVESNEIKQNIIYKDIEYTLYSFLLKKGSFLALIMPEMNTNTSSSFIESALISVFQSVSSVISGDNNQKKLWQLQRAIEQTPNGVLITDTTGKIEYANEAVCLLTGYSQEELLGNTPNLFKSDLNPPEMYINLWNTISSGRVWKGELRNKKKNGEVYWEFETISPVNDVSGQISHFVAFKQDIEYRKKRQQHAAKNMLTDFVTGLPNRDLIFDRIEQYRNKCNLLNSQVNLISIQISNFRFINIESGIKIGDKLLQEVADRLSKVLEQSDSVGRTGTSEFIIIPESIKNESELQVIVNALTSSLSKEFNINSEKITPLFSMNIISQPYSEFSLERVYDWIKNSSKVVSRESGESVIMITPNSKELNAKNTTTSKLDVAKGLSENQFELFYQPQINIRTGNVSGAEALIRWNHPEFGLIPPMQFIVEAEKSNDIILIGSWVIEAACRQISDWMSKNISPPRISINISARQLLNESIDQEISTAISRYKIPPELLEIELTETQMMEDPDLAIETLKRVKALGVGISGDDFGTGYSSLSYLKRIPLQRLKIDRSFINDITTDSNSRAIAELIIRLGQTLGLKVLAEGVEDVAQLSLLRQLNCDEFQGFLYSKPVPVDKFLNVISKPNSQIQFLNESVKEKVLVVDDEASVLNTIRRLLRKESYELITTISTQEALKILAKEHIKVVISDQKMPEMSGIDFLEKVKELYPDTVRIVLSGYTDLDTVVNAINKGSIYKFLSKPWDDDELKLEIDGAFNQYNKSNLVNR